MTVQAASKYHARKILSMIPILVVKLVKKTKKCNHGIKQYVLQKRMHYLCIEIIISCACLSKKKNTPQHKKHQTHSNDYRLAFDET